MSDTNDKKLLDDAREEINRIDSEMARLFLRRMRAVALVAEYKRAEGVAVYDPERERQVIALRFYLGMTQQNCAKVMHVSQVQISRLERRAVELLREKLE